MDGFCVPLFWYHFVTLGGGCCILVGFSRVYNLNELNPSLEKILIRIKRMNDLQDLRHWMVRYQYWFVVMTCVYLFVRQVDVVLYRTVLLYMLSTIAEFSEFGRLLLRDWICLGYSHRVSPNLHTQVSDEFAKCSWLFCFMFYNNWLRHMLRPWCKKNLGHLQQLEVHSQTAHVNSLLSLYLK